MHIAQHSDKQLLVHSCVSYTIEHCISAKLANKLEKIPRMKEKKWRIHIRQRYPSTLQEISSLKKLDKFVSWSKTTKWKLQEFSNINNFVTTFQHNQAMQLLLQGCRLGWPFTFRGPPIFFLIPGIEFSTSLCTLYCPDVMWRIYHWFYCLTIVSMIPWQHVVW
jgi:hypothetical protein